ncbi:hypothetical protein [Clostridium pasteurianum]|nr:hypothetical protein [Clostridium pasteurianum]
MEIVPALADKKEKTMQKIFIVSIMSYRMLLRVKILQRLQNL